jgi:hypothetical protein
VRPAPTGRSAPVDTDALTSGSRAGLGRSAQEEQLLAAETARRKQLAVEAQASEGEEQRAQRLERAADQARVKETVREMHRAFYCEVRACTHSCYPSSGRANDDGSLAVR